MDWNSLLASDNLLFISVCFSVIFSIIRSANVSRGAGFADMNVSKAFSSSSFISYELLALIVFQYFARLIISKFYSRLTGARYDWSKSFCIDCVSSSESELVSNWHTVPRWSSVQEQISANRRRVFILTISNFRQFYLHYLLPIPVAVVGLVWEYSSRAVNPLSEAREGVI